MNRCRQPKTVSLAALALLFPAIAIASDFSIFLYIFWGIAVVLMILLGVVAFYATKGVKSIILRSIVWGTLIALAATPVSTPGGNGTSSGPPILDIIISALGGDPVYAVGALKALLVSAPLCSLFVAVLIWGRPKQEGDSAGGDDT